MGGRGQDNPLQSLCQGNGATPACWLIICSVLMHCYKSHGFGSCIISPISGVAINFLGEIYVDNTNLIVTHPDLETPKAILEGLRRLGHPGSTAPAAQSIPTRAGGSWRPTNGQMAFGDTVRNRRLQ